MNTDESSVDVALAQVPATRKQIRLVFARPATVVGGRGHCTNCEHMTLFFQLRLAEWDWALHFPE